MRFYAGLGAGDLPTLIDRARKAEESGMHGLWEEQLNGTPFVNLAAVASSTKTLKLGSGIALAFTRSPLETALTALDMDLLTNGRFILGLGSGVQRLVEYWHGVPYGKPAPHLKENIQLVRMIMAKAHTGEPIKFTGEYYKVSIMGWQRPIKPVREKIPIYLAAVQAGATQVQGTINGYGERCGNANLCSIIANLKLKMGIDCVTEAQLTKLTEVARFVSETANLAPDPFEPYVGFSAFSHKGGLHVHGVNKWAGSYQHIDPALVGNRQRSVVSELSGRGNIIYKAKELGIDLPPQGKEAQKLLERIKWLESRGFQYENAEASFELLLRRAKPDYKPPFELVDFMVIVENGRRTPTRNSHDEMLAEAMIKVKIGNDIIHTAAEGNGPVNALDQALRKALVQFYPKVAAVQLIDYKVRILEESTGTSSQVRVLIESGDGIKEWRTVGSSTNIIEASWLALVDSLEYSLLKQNPSGKSSK